MVSTTFPGFKYSNFQSSCLFSSMNDPFSSKCKGVDNRASSSRVQTGGVESANMESAVEDMFVNFSDMMNIDSYAGWCNSPLVAEQMLASYGLSTAIHSVPTSYAPYDQLNFSEPSNIPLLVAAAGGGSAGSIGSPFTYIEKAVPNQGNNYLNDSSSKMEKHSTKQNLSTSLQNNSIPRPFGLSLAERMLRALSLFKESSSGGILAQLWVPVKSGDRCILSTCEQPFLLDQMLSGYREVSRAYTFSADQMPGSFAGLPGRVFISKIPEWTSDVGYYSIEEYLRVKHAADHQVRGSIAIPIFSNSDLSCCAVLELVTVKEKPCFDSELESVCLALQAVNLRTTELPRLRPQCLSVNQRSAVAEIADVLRAVCHAHRLPLALAWIPCTYVAGKDDDMIKVRVRDTSQSLQEKSILCVEETACYVTDPSMEGFLRACAEHPLEEGQGVAGRALVSNLPFFFPDVKKYHIKDYPLAHHARKYGLNAAVAIRLRSTHTGHDDYVLEFFLPVSMSGNKEQQLLLDSLSGTMQRLCKSLRTVSEEELVSDDSSNPCEVEADASFVPVPTPTGNLQTALLQSEPNTKVLDVSNANEDHVEVRSPTEQITSGSKRTIEKKRSTAEKNVSLSVLQQYFSGSLKDAAKSIGVCPTTLKRICRQHGISRWPSRKINKVNRSLRKIQTVLDSVQGVEGGLKLDPATGEIVAGGSLTQELQARKSHFQHNMLSPRNREQAEALMDTSNGNFISENGSPVKLEEGEPPYLFQNSFGSGLRSIFQSNKEELQDSIGTRNCSTTQPPSSAPFTVDLTFPRMNGEGDFEHQQPSCSSMTDSSNGSGSLSSSQDIEKKVKRTTNVSIGDSESRMIVKALYKDDMIRFRFDPALGYLHLYDEVAKRFKLPLGMIQLKYLDDDDEWVLLLNEADFQECLELMDTFGTRSMKFLVREVPAATGSSGSSNCFLGGSL